MSDDIVTRLRRITAKPLGLVLDPPPHPLCKEAADEIVLLRAALAVASGMISTMPQYEDQHPEAVMDMLLKEARRG